MAITFSTTADAGKNVNVLCYGKSGVGKTVLCSTAPDPIIISTESGLLSIAEHDIPVVEVNTLDDLFEAYEFVKKEDRWGTVCLDSLSDIAESVLSALKKNVRDPRQAYGELNSGMSDIIRLFRDLPCNVYMIAKAEVFENAAGMQSIRPSMPGKTLTRDLPYFFDTVLLLETIEDEEENIHRVLRTRESPSAEAKDRSGRLDKSEIPDLSAIFNKLARKKKKKKKKKKK